MVVIGHSMGGCITRLLLTNALIFKYRPEVSRAIFIAAPLRGSDLAPNRMGWAAWAPVSSKHPPPC